MTGRNNILIVGPYVATVQADVTQSELMTLPYQRTK